MRIALGFIFAPLTGIWIFPLALFLLAPLAVDNVTYKGAVATYLLFAYLGASFLAVPYFLFKKQKFISQNRSDSRHTCIVTGAIIGALTPSIILIGLPLLALLGSSSTVIGSGAKPIATIVGVSIFAQLFLAPFGAVPGALCGWSFWAIARPYKRDAVLNESGSIL